MRTPFEMILTVFVNSFTLYDICGRFAVVDIGGATMITDEADDDKAEKVDEDYDDDEDEGITSN